MLSKLDKLRNTGVSMIRLEETKVRTSTEMIKSDCLWGMNWVGAGVGWERSKRLLSFILIFLKNHI